MDELFVSTNHPPPASFRKNLKFRLGQVEPRRGQISSCCVRGRPRPPQELDFKIQSARGGREGGVCIQKDHYLIICQRSFSCIVSLPQVFISFCVSNIPDINFILVRSINSFVQYKIFTSLLLYLKSYQTKTFFVYRKSLFYSKNVLNAYKIIINKHLILNFNKSQPFSLNQLLIVVKSFYEYRVLKLVQT